MKPILFNTEMVRAILEGRKTVTRRVVKPQPAGDGSAPVPLKTRPWYWNSWGDDNVYRPPYQPGDILWVRETYHKDVGRYMYKANYRDGEKFFQNGKKVTVKWSPSIHMPREAARIFLRVTGVRVERLQEITPQQIDAEGCCEYAYDARTGNPAPSGPSWFSILWDKTIKPAELGRYGWDANPWVWVFDFERISKEEAMA